MWFNGKHIELTEEQKKALRTPLSPPTPIPYKIRVINRVREKYSIDDEIALLRQRDTKPEEFAEYNTYVEQIKTEERSIEE